MGFLHFKIFLLIHKFLQQSHDELGTNVWNAFFHLPTTCETSVIVSKKTSVDSTSGQSICDFFRRFGLVHKQFEPFSVFFLKKKNVCTNKNVKYRTNKFSAEKNFLKKNSKSP